MAGNPKLSEAEKTLWYGVAAIGLAFVVVGVAMNSKMGTLATIPEATPIPTVQADNAVPPGTAQDDFNGIPEKTPNPTASSSDNEGMESYHGGDDLATSHSSPPSVNQADWAGNTFHNGRMTITFNQDGTCQIDSSYHNTLSRPGTFTIDANNAAHITNKENPGYFSDATCTLNQSKSQIRVVFESGEITRDNTKRPNYSGQEFLDKF